VEEIRTSGNFTHFVWYVTPDMAGFDKVRAAFIADRDKRSQEERDAITASFAGLTDTTAFRSLVTRSLIIKMAPPK
jgi:hypothetical protein